MKHTAFAGRLLLLGFGSIGQAVLPLIRRHIDVGAESILILSCSQDGAAIAREYGASLEICSLTFENYKHRLCSLLRRGDFLINLSVNVSSVALIALCGEVGALYLDTCIEPWPGTYTNPLAEPSRRSNHALRESILELKSTHESTAVVAHGANPGLVSHFAKVAISQVADRLGKLDRPLDTREEWAALACELDIRTIHVTERDSQASRQPKNIGEFVNTWSVDGFSNEARQPAELGWGTHELSFPEDGRRHQSGSDAAIYLLRPGGGTRVRSWTPSEASYHGFLISHNEVISIAEYFTIESDCGCAYRPTVLYTYHPCDSAVLSLYELAGRNWKMQDQSRISMNDIVSGSDELGVLVMGHRLGAYWYGSRLSIDQARSLAPHSNATTLQVAAGVLGGLVWAIENPRSGIVEPDYVDHCRVLSVAKPYLGDIVGVYTNWTPLSGRSQLFPEDIDRSCPWQFRNFRVS